WRGNGTALTPAPELIDLTDYALQNYPGNDHSGNYGTVWSDFDNDGDLDLMIAKCRQFINDPFDPRRQNQLWVNDGTNFYTEEAADRGLVLNEQSWTADFADVDNDGDWDCFITTHSATMKLMINDGTGHFTDGTAGSGLGVSGFCLQAKLADFDNDGYVDVVLGGGIHRYFHNNGNGTFTEMSMFPATDTMHSFAFGDVNRDGFMDVYASYGNGYNSPDNGNPDRLWLNDGNTNHWIAFDLQGIVSNKDAVGAKVTITGSFGTQVREVRAGESYGITNTFHCMFGLGTATEIDQVTIEWPAGLTTVIENPAIDQYHSLLEAECTVAVAIEANATEVCPGTTATLTVPGTFESILWSNGSTDAVLEVGMAGVYSATVFTAEGCAGATAPVEVVVVEPGVPQVTLLGELEFCSGTSAELIAPNGTAWTWSNNATTQSITVTESGTYSVSMVDICGNAGYSEEFTFTVFPSPANPVVQDVEVTGSGSVELTATGSNLRWYDAEAASTPIFEGNPFVTPVLTETTTYWVEDFEGSEPVTAIGGETTMDAGQYHDNSTRWMIFDAHEDLVLVSVKVFANGAGVREFGVIDAGGSPVGNNVTVNVPDGESTVELGIEVPAGTDYGLRCYTGNPQLWRDGLGSTLNYPYDLGELATITQSTAGQQNATNYYYFFYDWVVETPSVACPSDRVPVTVTVVGVEEAAASLLQAFPNPASGEVVLTWPAVEAVRELVIADATGRLVDHIPVATATGRTVLDVSGWAPGVYSVSAGTSVVRLVVQ
ncbi:MAG: FG-GAP-like repeat-containing protein, partial [Flavobacteriales bacterium]